MSNKVIAFGGQQVHVGDGVWLVTVDKVFYEPGWPKSIGLREDLVESAIKSKVTLYVRNSKNGNIVMYPEDWKKKSWVHAFKHNEGTVKYYMYPLPPAK